MFSQLINPNPHIPCQPGWCLQYVRQAFGLPAKYPTATAAWNASTSKHRDRNFPAGVWVPVWYALANEPAGHVVLRAPDGSVFSTSDNSNVPHHHPDLGDLERFYARYGMPLTYRGWTEDVASFPVVGLSVHNNSNATAEDEEMPSAQEIAEAVLVYPVAREGSFGGETCLKAVVAWYDAGIQAVISGTVAGVLAGNPGASADEISSAIQNAIKGSQITFTAGG